MTIVKRVFNILRIGLFWDTMREIEKLKRINSKIKRINELERFLNRIKNRLPIEYNNQMEMKEWTFFDWDRIYDMLWYYSDRWCLSRACNIMFYIEQGRRKGIL